MIGPEQIVACSAPTAPSGAYEPHTHAVGEVIDDRYSLCELLGIGGMGAVWRAHDLLLDIDVALKLVRPREAFPGALARLLCEARAAVCISHPSVVRVLSFGQSGPDAYIAMELLVGETLEAKLEREHSLAPVEAVRLLLPIAKALAAAHSRQVVHRDVKPANIFLSEGEGVVVPKLLDFGIARAQQPVFERLTSTGQVIGTPHYMSPEQASGRADVDHRADIWGLCAVLYEAIRGTPPFDGTNYNAVISAVLMDRIAPLVESSSADRELSEVVRRGLEKQRSARYGSIDELVAALEQWLAAHELMTSGERVRPLVTIAAPRLSRTLPSAWAPQTRPVPPTIPMWPRLSHLGRAAFSCVRHPRAWGAAALSAVLLAVVSVASGDAAATAPRLARGLQDLAPPLVSKLASITAHEEAAADAGAALAALSPAEGALTACGPVDRVDAAATSSPAEPRAEAPRLRPLQSGRPPSHPKPPPAHDGASDELAPMPLPSSPGY